MMCIISVDEVIIEYIYNLTFSLGVSALNHSVSVSFAKCKSKIANILLKVNAPYLRVGYTIVYIILCN